MSRTLTLALVLAVPVAGMAQGKLDQVRDAVDKPHATSKDRDFSDSSSDSSSSSALLAGTPAAEGSDNSTDGSVNLFLFGVAAPWWIPYSIFDPGFDINGRFSVYPYAREDTGYIFLFRKHENGAATPDSTFTRGYSVRASLETGSNFDGLDRVGLRLFLDTDTRFGLKSDWDYYTERLSCGSRDKMWFGDVTPTFRFVQNKWLMMNTGLGARFTIDNHRDRAGVNFLYGFDAFPVKPVHLFGSFEAGTLGHATVYRWHGGVGVNWTQGEVFAGYDFLRIGGVDLQGPMVGLRLWFGAKR